MTVLLHAAGSLRDALTDIAAAFEAASGIAVHAKYGPSGTLRDAIAGCARADVFASANMAHPESLGAAGRSGPVVRFARNRLCALVRPGLEVTPESLLERMCADDVRLATSTPRADRQATMRSRSLRKPRRSQPAAAPCLSARLCN